MALGNRTTFLKKRLLSRAFDEVEVDVVVACRQPRLRSGRAGRALAGGPGVGRAVKAGPVRPARRGKP